MIITKPITFGSKTISEPNKTTINKIFGINRASILIRPEVWFKLLVKLDKIALLLLFTCQEYDWVSTDSVTLSDRLQAMSTEI